MGAFLEELHHVSEHTHREPGVIVIVGGGGLGKTKLLRAMKAKAADMGFRSVWKRLSSAVVIDIKLWLRSWLSLDPRVVSGIGGLVEQNTPFFTVKTLITRLLGLDNCKNIHEREQLVLEHVTDDELKKLLPLLNDLLVLKVGWIYRISGLQPVCIYIPVYAQFHSFHKLL